MVKHLELVRKIVVGWAFNSKAVVPSAGMVGRLLGKGRPLASRTVILYWPAKPQLAEVLLKGVCAVAAG